MVGGENTAIAVGHKAHTSLSGFSILGILYRFKSIPDTMVFAPGAFESQGLRLNLFNYMQKSRRVLKHSPSRVPARSPH